MLKIAGSLLVLLLAIASSQVQAATGRAYRGMRLDHFKVEGIDRSLSSSLRDGLALSERSGFLRLKRARFYPSLLQDDLERTRLFMARHGYPHATVEAELTPNEKRTKVGVKLTIQPGDPVRISSMSIDGVGTNLVGDAQKSLGLKVGDIFTDRASKDAEVKLLQFLFKAGHAKATVQFNVQAADSNHVQLKFVAVPGPTYTLRQVQVDGVPHSFDNVVKRSANIDEGEPYRPLAIIEAEEGVRNLRLFRQVRIQPVPVDSTTLDLRFDLSERDHRTIQFGGGFITQEGPFGYVSWEHRNLFKAGRGFQTGAGASIFHQYVDASITWPALFSSATRGTAQIAVRRDDEPGYVQLSFEASYIFNYRRSRRLTLRGGPNFQLINLDDQTIVDDPTADPGDIPPEIAESEGPITKLVGDIVYDGSDDIFYPRKGIGTVWQNEITLPDLGSITHFYKTSFQVTGYRGMGPVVLAGKIKVGAGFPLADSQDLLISDRFFSGGAASHRGYQRRRLGPKDDKGDPIGGEFLLESSVELRFPLFGIVEGSVFLDIGQVWPKPEFFGYQDIQFAAGPGLAIRTPVGPIRFDFGFRLNPPPDDGLPDSVFHFAVGFAF